MKHLPESQLSGYAAQSLSELEADQVLDHLSECESCSQRLEELELQNLRNLAGASQLSPAQLNSNSLCDETAFRRLVEKARDPTVDRADESTPAEGTGESQWDEIPQEVGPYRLGRLLGEGGFGIVYEASQFEPIRRKVAVKLIKPGRDTRRVIARFEAERHALAMMDHRNIAKALDAGSTKSGHPYFVMELVEGQPITDYSREHDLSLNVRIQLMIDACRALQHAHQKGVIHRDIKPSNVLVTLKEDQPVVKVIDFGVAKALHEPLLAPSMETQAEHIVGTPLYMSPEQAAGEGIDTRSDVYGLGALLYELLTGSTPFSNLKEKNLGRAELLRAIAEDDVQCPSERLGGIDRSSESPKNGKFQSRDLRGDLDWIVLRSLARESHRRYQSAGELSADLQRYLDGDAVLATPPTLAYRAAKFWKKNRSLISATTIILGILFASAVGSYVVLKRSNDQLKAAAARIEQEKENAEGEVARKREAVDFLIRTFERIDFANRDINNSTLAIQLLFDAFEDLKRNTDNRISDPIVRGELVFEVGRLLKVYGYYEKAIDSARRACEIFKRELGEDSKPYVDSRIMLASSLRRSGKFEEALQIFRGLAEEYLNIFPSEKMGAAKRWNDVAVCLEELGRYKEALEIYERVISQKRDILGDSHRSVLLSENNVAIVYSRFGQHERAIEIMESVVDRSEVEFGRNDKETMDNMHSLAFVYLAGGKAKEAQETAAEVLAYLEKKLTPEHMDRLSTKWLLGQTLWNQGGEKRAEAIKTYEEVLADIRLDASHPRLLKWNWLLQSRYAEFGDVERSRSLKRSVLTTAYHEVHEPGSARSVNSARQLAELLIETGDYSQAKEIIREVQDVLKSMSITELVLEPTELELVKAIQELSDKLKEGTQAEASKGGE